MRIIWVFHQIYLNFDAVNENEDWKDGGSELQSVYDKVELETPQNGRKERNGNRTAIVDLENMGEFDYQVQLLKLNY